MSEGFVVSGLLVAIRQFGNSVSGPNFRARKISVDGDDFGLSHFEERV